MVTQVALAVAVVSVLLQATLLRIPPLWLSAVVVVVAQVAHLQMDQTHPSEPSPLRVVVTATIQLLHKQDMTVVLVVLRVALLASATPHQRHPHRVTTLASADQTKPHIVQVAVVVVQEQWGQRTRGQQAVMEARGRHHLSLAHLLLMLVAVVVVYLLRELRVLVDQAVVVMAVLVTTLAVTELQIAVAVVAEAVLLAVSAAAMEVAGLYGFAICLVPNLQQAEP